MMLIWHCWILKRGNTYFGISKFADFSALRDRWGNAFCEWRKSREEGISFGLKRWWNFYWIFTVFGRESRTTLVNESIKPFKKPFILSKRSDLVTLDRQEATLMSSIRRVLAETNCISQHDEIHRMHWLQSEYQKKTFSLNGSKLN